MPPLSTIVIVAVPPENEPELTVLVRVVMPFIVIRAPPEAVANDALEPFWPNELMPPPLPTTNAVGLIEMGDVDIDVKSPSALYASVVV